MWTSSPAPNSPSSSPAPPPDKISVCFYILSDFLKSTSFFPILFNRGDLLGINLHWNNAPTSSNLKSLKILNAYNRHISPLKRSIPPHLLFSSSLTLTLVCRDFNIHHSKADPSRPFTKRESDLAIPYFQAATDHSFSLLNTPGRFTRHSANPLQKHSVIDLSFTNTHASNLVTSWTNKLPPTGSDHTPIRIKLVTSTSSLPQSQNAPDWKKAPWKDISKLLKETTLPPCYSPIDK